MKLLKVSIVIIALVFSAAALYAADDQIVLWGKQTKGWGHSVNAKTDGNAVELKKTAKIVKVEGNAKSFCIWSGGRSVLCGKEDRSIVGETLGKGRYTVLPGLSKGQSESKVTIYMEYEVEK